MKKEPPPNFPFDVAELINGLLRKDPKHASEMAELLEIQSWIPRLWATGGRQEVLAGNMLTTAVMSAHSYAKKWERLAAFLEFLGNLDTDYELEWVDQQAAYMKASWSHPYLLTRIPKAKRGRIIKAIKGPFYANNFDQEFFDSRQQQLDRFAQFEREERAAKRKAAKDRTMP